MNPQLNKESIINARQLTNDQDYQVFEEIAQLSNQGTLTIEDFDTICHGFYDDSEDFDFLSEGLSECLNRIMEGYPIETYVEKLVDAIEIFNDHAIMSYGFILSQWFIDEEKRTILSGLINRKSEETKEIFRRVLNEQIAFYNNYDGLGYMAGSANKLLQGIK
ncbi:hypothetical protein [Emticicia sp. C21]|uniref:hypothetical protein n=1 Tax=Emticicia sp. C21 TaxID=2302915 RepID=UPI000E347DF9|nr:hypothetical protein [Emticicia sp. C21]RFS16617.1 hypothetical protein D0T08_07995 [Emticicia sp. C21]